MSGGLGQKIDQSLVGLEHIQQKMPLFLWGFMRNIPFRKAKDRLSIWKTSEENADMTTNELVLIGEIRTWRYLKSSKQKHEPRSYHQVPFPT